MYIDRALLIQFLQTKPGPLTLFVLTPDRSLLGPRITRCQDTPYKTNERQALASTRLAYDAKRFVTFARTARLVSTPIVP